MSYIEPKVNLEALRCEREYLPRIGVLVRCGASECTALPLKWSSALGLQLRELAHFPMGENQSPAIFVAIMELVQCGIAAVFYGITQVDFYIDNVDIASLNMPRLAYFF